MSTPTVAGIHSTSQKTYTLSLDGCEPREKPYSRQVMYRPTRLVVVKRNGNVHSVTLSGPKVKSDGSDGATWADETMYRPVAGPAWLTSIIGGLA